MDGLSIGTVWKLMSWLPGFLLRWFFSKQWLAKHVNIDVRPRHDQVTIRGGDLPEVEIWLTVTNKGYFDIELDRLSAEFTFAGAIACISYLRRTEIKPAETKELLVRATLSSDQVAHITKNAERPYVALHIHADFNSKIHTFAVDSGSLSGIKPELMNIRARLGALSVS